MSAPVVALIEYDRDVVGVLVRDVGESARRIDDDAQREGAGAGGRGGVSAPLEGVME